MTSHGEKINNLFYFWLKISFILIFIMVVVGGLTRLTNSGLSITEWELFVGILPPLNNETWNKYFQLYREIPQYKLINNEMTLEEFKIIFYWEYIHRFLGRLIGLFFLIPLIYFYLAKTINKKILKNCYLIFSLIVLQGAIGWYMVKSGLVNNITVSHFRLSLHLSLAFIIISLIFWNLLNIKENKIKPFFINKNVNYFFYILILLLFIQIIVGAFVSGLDAGLIYQTWPLMDYTYFPNDVVIKKIYDFFNFYDHGLVQFYHRNIAYIIFAYILFLGILIHKNKMTKVFKSYFLVLFFLLLQIVLGIFTLISGLNIFFASLHQICGLLLTLSVINLYYRYIN